MLVLARPLAALLVLTLPGIAQPATRDLAGLRETAVAVVNADRREHGLAGLEPDDTLDTIARAHAEDMLARNYVAHESPDGETVADRFRAAGGRASAILAENLATCTGCRVPPGPERVRTFQNGWMESPGHRATILREGIDRFGFGIAGDPESGRVVAVQTFAGPGVPRGDGSRTPLDPDAVLAETLEKIATLRDAGAKLDVSRPLAAAARRLAEEAVVAAPDDEARPALDVAGALPEASRADFGRIAALFAACTGCGARPTRADVQGFVAQLGAGRGGALRDPEFDRAGAALAADGDGRKVMVVLLAERRER